MIELQNIQQFAKKETFIHPVSLKIEKGETLLIKGNNGSGKTTLAKIIMGKSGSFDGKVIHNFQGSPLHSAIAYVPAGSFTSLFSANEELYYQQRYNSSENKDVKSVRSFLDNIDGNILKLLRQFHLYHLLDLELTRLSNGQMRKLVLVKALVKKPQLLILDYPYTGLDKESCAELNQLLEKVRENKIGIVIIDNSDNAPAFIDHIVSLSKEVKKVVPHKVSTTQIDVPAETLVSLKNINLQYGNKRIFQGLSWEIKTGEKWTVKGNNGSGKSSLLAMIFGDHPQAYAKDVYLFGKKRGAGQSIWEIKNKVNMLSPEMATYLSARREPSTVLQFLLHQHPMLIRQDKHELRQRAVQGISFFNIEHLQDRSIHSISSGEIQLMLLIKTFIVPKKLVLLDEPLQFLDEHNKQLARNFILQNVGSSALVYISHESDEALLGIEKTLQL